LAAMVTLGQYINFSNLYYNTDLYIKRYGHITQDRMPGTEMSDKFDFKRDYEEGESSK
jgi:hypothetical protein